MLILCKYENNVDYHYSNHNGIYLQKSIQKLEEVRWEIKEVFRVNELMRFAENLGINVKFKDFKASYGRMQGMEDRTIRIGICKGLSEEDATYTLAHELAHIYLHIDKGNTITSPYHDEYEEQADRAARMLLDFIGMKGVRA